MVTTKPTVKRPTVGFAPTAGLPREERRDGGLIEAANHQQSRTAAETPVVKYQRVYHLTPSNLAPYDAMTFPSLQQRWQTQPQQGEIVAVSASVDGEMVGFIVTEISIERTVELLSLFVVSEYRQQGIETHLVAQIQQDLSSELGTQVKLLRSNSHPPQTSAQILFAQGKQARRAGNLLQAQACFEEAIQLQPNFVPAYNNLGNLFQVQGEIAKAIKTYQQALTLAPNLPALHCNLASLWQTQGDRDLAITGYQKSIDLDPNFWLAHYNLGKIFAADGDLSVAISAYQSALKINPNAEIELELGHIYRQQGLIPETIDCYRRAIHAQPQSAPAYNCLGSMLFEQRDFKPAEAAYRRALGFDRHYGLAHRNLAFLLAQTNRLEESLIHWERALALQAEPDLDTLYNENHLQLKLANWENYDRRLADLVTQTTAALNLHSSVNSGLLLTAFPVAPALQTAIARKQAFSYVRSAKVLQSQFTRVLADLTAPRLRIGYVSPDFRTHPVGILIHQMFQYHQRPDFEIFAYSLCPVVDEFTAQIQAGCDHYLDVADRSTLEIAQQIQADGIHILIDLAGYTTNSHAQIFALQPAPIQIQYMGYPGTMGADFIQYILADRHLIPPELTQHYTETPIYLDRAWVASPMPIAPSDLTRTDWGLPAVGTVFCCFNSTYKIEPKVFQSWMRILQQVPSSVLWLADCGIPIIIDRLRQQAATLGVDPHRLIFSPNLPHAEYLARYQFADIFLDTFTYNAGATAVGALSAGLPILTCPGETYVSRMCASICHSAGLSELVCDTPSSYERLAIDLGNDPSQLHALKAKVVATMMTSPLFQPQLFIRNLERELHRIWQIHLNKSDPA